MKKSFLLLLLITGMAHAQDVNIPDAAFKAALISFGYDTNSDGIIQVSEVQSRTNLDVSYMGISDLTGISSFTSLITLHCNATLGATSTLTSIDVSAITTLEELYVMDNDITSATLNTNIRQAYLNGNQLTLFDPSPYPDLLMLDLANNHLTEFTMHGNGSLELGLNDLTQVNLSGGFGYLSLINNNLETIDLSQVTAIGSLWFEDNPVTVISFKNDVLQSPGSLFVGSDWLPDQLYICTDDNSEMLDFQSYSDTHGLHWVVNPYCSFTPGGNYNTITGTALFDANGNGCDAGDIQDDFIKINITDGNNPGSTFSTLNGNYTFYTGAGNFTVTPQIDNPDWFTITPANAVVNFPADDNSVAKHNFCIVSNGPHPDLEIAVFPYTPLRPGFDAEFKIVYRNKGSETLSGTATLAFDDDRMDFVSAAPTPNVQSAGLLAFDFNNLLPFAHGSAVVTFNVNAPTDVPPVNDGDLFDFMATVNPVAGDEMPDDNISAVQMVATNSYDPNDKTCLEGATVTPERIGQYLHYNINFENIGTAEAVNIVVKDAINPDMFDINTLQVMESSHPVEAQIRGNNVEFVFRNINLPSAISNPIGGHGNVLFKIKTMPFLQAGSIVTNTAKIYFDYNHPVLTNEARTTFSTLQTREFPIDESVSVYPNPVSDKVQISAANRIQSVALYDLQGRILQVSNENEHTVTLDLSTRQSGVYFAQVTTEKGNKIVKLVKQ